MADEQHEIRHIRWNEVFSFTQIFKSFRLAIHPSKLLLGLMAVIIIFTGGWVMDGVWSITKTNVMDDEIACYTQVPRAEFREMVKKWEDSRTDDAAALWRSTEKTSLLRFSRFFPGTPLRTAFDQVVKDANLAPYEKPEPGDMEWDDLLRNATQAADDARERADNFLKQAKKKASETIENGGLIGDERDEALAELK
jgi:hypothetical protein